MNTIKNVALSTNIANNKRNTTSLKNGITMQQHYNSAIAFGAKIPKLKTNYFAINLGKNFLNSIKSILTKSKLPDVLDPVVVANNGKIDGQSGFKNTVEKYKLHLDSVSKADMEKGVSYASHKSNDLKTIEELKTKGAPQSVINQMKRDINAKGTHIKDQPNNLEHTSGEVTDDGIHSGVSDATPNMDGAGTDLGNQTVDFDDIAPVDLHTGIAEHLGNSASDLADAVANGADAFAPITDHVGNIASDHAGSVADAVHNNVGEHIGNVVSDNTDSVINTIHDIIAEHGTSLGEKIIDIFSILF